MVKGVYLDTRLRQEITDTSIYIEVPIARAQGSLSFGFLKRGRFLLQFARYGLLLANEPIPYC